MRRSRWARAVKKFERAFDNITYYIMVLRNMDERERNIEKFTGENHRFCEDKYLETPIEF